MRQKPTKLQKEVAGLRVALLSLMEAVVGEPQALRGLLPIGGRSVLRHQLGLAMALGCARIVVLAETLTGDLVTLQHAAEAGGARFHVIASARAGTAGGRRRRTARAGRGPAGHA